MNLKQNFSDKIRNFSTKCTPKEEKSIFSKKISLKTLVSKTLTDRYETPLRRRPALPDLKQDPDPESGRAESSLKVRSGVGSETNNSGSTTLDLANCTVSTFHLLSRTVGGKYVTEAR
jgi:hypothetical protein